MAAEKKLNQAEEVRAILKRNKEITGPQVLEKLQKKFPKHKFSKGSVGVAFSNARKDLGLVSTKKKTTKKKAAKKVARKSKKTSVVSSGEINDTISKLRRAQQFAEEVGGVEEAQAALSGLQELDLA